MPCRRSELSELVLPCEKAHLQTSDLFGLSSQAGRLCSGNSDPQNASGWAHPLVSTLRGK